MSTTSQQPAAFFRRWELSGPVFRLAGVTAELRVLAPTTILLTLHLCACSGSSETNTDTSSAGASATEPSNGAAGTSTDTSGGGAATDTSSQAGNASTDASGGGTPADTSAGSNGASMDAANGAGGATASTSGASTNTSGGAGTATTDTSSGAGGSPADSGGNQQNMATSGDAVVDASRFSVAAQLASDIDPNALGTVAIVEWSVDVMPEHASLEFGLDTNYGMTAPVDLSEPNYRTVLLGMKPDKEYHYRVVVVSGGATIASDDYTISTGPATDLVALDSFEVVDAAAVEPGFIVSEFFQSGGGGASGGGSVAFIVDADGDIVWWHQSSLPSLARARMSADGKNMWLVISGLQGGVIERVSMDTLDSQTYDVGASHDIAAVSGETMAYLDYSEPDCNSIYEITPDGVVGEVFESQDVVSGQCHGNAVRYSAKEDVYTFSDHQVDIYVVDRSTGELSWKLSDRVGPNSTWGGAQHGHQLLDNSFLIFANNGGDGQGSGPGGQGAAAAIEYDLNGTELRRFSEGISTSNLGDVQRLPGGNTLITYSTSWVLHELDSSGSPVLVIDFGRPVGYSEWRPSLYGAPTDISL